jgi:sulfatase maturation enzyme AslB (radical SAM superfamily)
MYYHNDKKVYPCCKLAGVEKFALGNTNDSIETLWNGSVLTQLRKDIINGTEPSECYYHCFNNINPLHLYLPEEFRVQQEYFFQKTAADGTFDPNLVIWNINESNVCNFKCVYCCSNFSNQFDKKAPIRKSFDSVDEMLDLFRSNAPTIKMLFLSSGESYMQQGYYKMLDILIELGLTDIQLNVHTNLSGYKYGKRHFYELLNCFKNVTVFASLDSYGERAEYIREGTVWKDIEESVLELKKFSNIKLVVQSVITNLNLWSLPDFHTDWCNKGFIQKEDFRYFCLNTPEELYINVLSEAMKEKIKNKYESYLAFLEDSTCTLYNTMTLKEKVMQILKEMRTSPKVPKQLFDFYILKKDIKSSKKFLATFPEFKEVL